MPIIDLEVNESIKELLADSKNGEIDVDPNPYFSRYALNTSLTLNYGVRIDGTVDNELLNEIFHVERIISNLRSTSNNWQDYIPLMRLWPSRNQQAQEYRARRDKYLKTLLDMLKDKMAKGEDKPCITGNILKDPEAKLNEGISFVIDDLNHALTYLRRNQIYLPNHGVSWPRYGPWESYNGHWLSLFSSRPRNPSQSLLRDHESIPRR